MKTKKKKKKKKETQENQPFVIYPPFFAKIFQTIWYFASQLPLLRRSHRWQTSELRSKQMQPRQPVSQPTEFLFYSDYCVYLCFKASTQAKERETYWQVFRFDE